MEPAFQAEAFPEVCALFWFCGLDVVGSNVSLALENRDYIAALRDHRVCDVRFVAAGRCLGGGAPTCRPRSRAPAEGLGALEVLPWAGPCAAQRRLVLLFLDAFDLAGAGYPLGPIRRCVAALYPQARIAAVLRFIADTDACWVPEEVLRDVDLIWVPSAHSAATLLAPGLPVAHTVVIPEICQRPACPAPVAPGDGEAFVFLAVMNDYGLDDCLRPDVAGPHRWNAARKNLAGLLEAFCSEFPAAVPAAPRILVKSTRAGLHWDIATFLADLGCAECAERIEVVDEWVEDIGMFLRRGHCLVAPSRGEGWCRPLAEALCAGVPAIGIAFGGQTDFLSERTGYVVPNKRAECRYALGRGWTGRAFWAEVEVAELGRTMRHVRTHYEEALAKAVVGQRLVSQRCSPGAVAAAICEQLIRPLLQRSGLQLAALSGLPRPLVFDAVD